MSGVDVSLLVGAKNTTRLNQPPFGGNNQGPSRASNPTIDAALIVAGVDEGKIAGHYDRNTFFNLNGAGTNINRFDNKQYALNLFGWLVGAFDPLEGDYNGSGVVDALDYDLWVSAFGATGTHPADGNGNGVVDAADFTIWRDNEGAQRPDLDLTVPSVALAVAGTEVSSPLRGLVPPDAGGAVSAASRRPYAPVLRGAQFPGGNRDNLLIESGHSTVR